MNRVEELVRRAGDFGIIDEGLTVNKLVQDESGYWFKIRGYSSEEEAQEKEILLKCLVGAIDFPELIGRWQNFLVFRYILLEDESTQPREESFFQNLGEFISRLNQFDWVVLGEEVIGQEFNNWLIKLEKMRLIPPWIARSSALYYLQMKPHDLPVVLDYWDAMPHNFAVYQGRFTMLDEKHLRPSFLGVGLVKPFLLLDKNSWKSLSKGYERVAPLDNFYKHRSFLEFYYLVAALYFYSLTSAAGRVSLGSNRRFLDYRDRLIALVSPQDRLSQIKCELHLYARYPRHIASLLRRRLYRKNNLKPEQVVS